MATLSPQGGRRFLGPSVFGARTCSNHRTCVRTALLAVFLGFTVLLPSVVVLVAPSPAAAADDEDNAKKLRSYKKQLKAALASGNDQDVKKYASRISKLGGEKATEILFQLALQTDSRTVYTRLLRYLARMKDSGAFEFFDSVAKESDKKYVRKVLLADTMARAKSERAGKVLGVLAESKNVKVLFATIDALVTLRNRESIDPLLRLLERFEQAKSYGLEYEAVREGLFAVTGHDFDAFEDWMKWWEPVRETFEPGKQDDGKTRVAKPKSRSKYPEFAGKTILSNHVVFVIDTSGSMRFVHKWVPGLSTAAEGDATAGSQPDEKLTPENARIAKYWSRMEMAKRALIRALQGFRQKFWVNVVTFDSKIKAWQKKLAKATNRYRKKTTERVKGIKLTPRGATDTFGALKQAMTSDESTTAIYFLSDGLPSKDGQVHEDTNELLKKLKFVNRFRKVKVHTFGFDPMVETKGGEKQLAQALKDANEFLKKLAKSTGGTFTLLKVTNEDPPDDFH